MCNSYLSCLCSLDYTVSAFSYLQYFRFLMKLMWSMKYLCIFYNSAILTPLKSHVNTHHYSSLYSSSDLKSIVISSALILKVSKILPATFPEEPTVALLHLLRVRSSEIITLRYFTHPRYGGYTE